ncbi:hypothetical protein PTSG_12915 [Salpingoeca rosetta]|uniref:PH domain-containing protein n=1 Tax=Salpingoeca rosetta (strain ATCC 50818 / BSB-021) TaxID=946362 RepID=F2UNW8_SALR5|nr:uncharacterized protein PTSG_12915 [Salpingoeca rosetta]EGD79323.1 hypothetical protein PTSG_12915 [Salpingoeca rosetta]|eukprot:XP_004989092.1 hypothetical protein PTSG_12915 [Salpingoeca rosetta]
MNNNNSTTMADGGVRGRAVLELVRVAPQAQVVRAGHIELAQQGTKMGYSHTTWKQRLFKLNATSLRYYKNEKSTTPKGIITLTPFCLAQPCNRGDLRALNSSASVKLVKNRPVRDRVNRDNGVALLVPEENRTYYIHFQSTRVSRNEGSGV